MNFKYFLKAYLNSALVGATFYVKTTAARFVYSNLTMIAWLRSSHNHRPHSLLAEFYKIVKLIESNITKLERNSVSQVQIWTVFCLVPPPLSCQKKDRRWNKRNNSFININSLNCFKTIDIKNITKKITFWHLKCNALKKINKCSLSVHQSILRYLRGTSSIKFFRFKDNSESAIIEALERW